MMFSVFARVQLHRGHARMLGGVLGSLVIIGMGHAGGVGFLLVLAVGALFGIVYRDRRRSAGAQKPDQHLAFSHARAALMVQHTIEWGTSRARFRGCSTSPARI
jgi:hypothetical protein